MKTELQTKKRFEKPGDFSKRFCGLSSGTILIIHGCPIACTSEFNLAVSENRRIRMGSPEDLPAAIEQLRKIVLAGWMQKEGVSDL